MAEISITAGNVTAGSDAEYFRGVAGATIAQGQAVYLDEMTNTLKHGDANLSLEASEIKGIALNAASAGQDLLIQTSGEINIGATVVLATVYILGAGGSGGIAPVSDSASGWYTSVIGVASSASKLRLDIFNSRALKA